MNAATRDIAAALPSNLEAEQGVLGAILLNNDLINVVGFLRPWHFEERLHRAIFETMLARLGDGRPATVLTMADDLPVIDADFTAKTYLAKLAAAAWNVSEQIVGTAKEIVSVAARRRLAGLAEDIRAGVSIPGALASDLISAAELQLIELSEEIGQLTASDQAASPDRIVSEIGRRMTTGEHYKGAQSGLVAIDERLGGFAPGEFIVIAGRPGMGKSLLGLSLARRAAHIGTGIGFDTIEMTKENVWHRLLSDECLGTEKIAYKAIARGKLNALQYDLIGRASARLKELPLYVLDRGHRLSDLPAHIRAARRFLERKGKALDLFVIDYLGLLQPTDRYAGQKVNEVGEISATVKALAKREGIAIIGLHQLNRANEARGEDRRPRLSDLRDSGNLEQDADVVMFVYREAYYIERPGYRNFEDDGKRLDALADTQHKMEVIVAKQRQGEIGTARLWCDAATNSVRDEARI